MRDVLQVVAFDVPFPPNYGGAVDVFYRLKALHHLGAAVHLHAFRYRDRQSAPELREYCAEVFYYERVFHPRLFFNRLPFIVVSRMADNLLERLGRGRHPVLFEGIHTCGFLGHPALRDHRKLVRMHNAEATYYRNLSRLQGNPLRRWYMLREARKIEAFEPRVMEHAQVILPISTRDEQYFRTRGANASLVPAFHGQREVSSLEGRGEYVLFQGNLSVKDNEKAALFLMRKVMTGPGPPLVIAGLRPSNRLRSACARAPHVMLAENPTREEMDDLIRQAQVNLLYTFQPDGIKIKLLHALFKGRHVVCNPLMARGSGLESLCTLAEDPITLRNKVHERMRIPFDKHQKKLRKHLLHGNYQDDHNAGKVLELAFPRSGE